MTPYQYNIPQSGTLYKGDTLDTVTFTGITVDDVVVNLTDITITAQIRELTKTGRLLKNLSEGSGITVTSAASGNFRIDAFVIDFPVGTHYYDIQFVDDSGNTYTYIYGTITITQDVTT